MLYEWTAQPPEHQNKQFKLLKLHTCPFYFVVDNLSPMSFFLLMYINFRWWCVVRIFKLAFPLSLLSTAARQFS